MSFFSQNGRDDSLLSNALMTPPRSSTFLDTSLHKDVFGAISGTSKLRKQTNKQKKHKKKHYLIESGFLPSLKVSRIYFYCFQVLNCCKKKFNYFIYNFSLFNFHKCLVIINKYVMFFLFYSNDILSLLLPYYIRS